MNPKTQTKRRSPLLPLILWLLIPILGGPAPGAVGGCGCGDDPLDAPVDLEAYCLEREQLVCVRAFERGKGSVFDRDDCRRAAAEVCANRSFPRECEPSQRQAQACLNALHSRSTLERRVNQLRECRDLCDFDANPDANPVDGGMQ